METVVRTPVQIEGELHLLTHWEVDRRREGEAGVTSVILHVLAIILLALLPKSLATAPQFRSAPQITPLIEPPTELTQTAPNKGKISKELTAEQLLPRPRIQIPRSELSTTRGAARTLTMPGPPPAPPPAQSLPEPPKIEAGAAAKTPEAPQIAQALTPQIQPAEQPKLTLETPPAASAGPAPGAGGLVARPNTSVDEAVRAVVRGSGSGRLTVGDAGPEDIGGLGPGFNLPPSPGKVGSNLELLSDPLGVDFRPYLIRILTSVRRNWFAVMPESAKLGRSGRVAIQFAISRSGSVPKLVIVSPSGTEAFDRAAVAGISASNPFPPLPAEFKGDQIRLQFNFAYNIRTR
ncbi:MAG TPA: TonB family protein [Bryobacteraceae bacterium]|nr:TonB family protein [Bryobacteraceae bacterium]